MKPEMGPPEVEVTSFPGEDTSWQSEFDAFVGAIEGRATHAATIGDAHRAMEIVYDVYREIGPRGLRRAEANDMGPPDAPTALITGGAKGIGLAMAEALVRSGWNLVVWGRDERALSHLAATERTTERAIEWAAVDLSESGAAAAAFCSLIASRPLPDALICNAGNYGVLGAIGQVDLRLEEVVRPSIFSPRPSSCTSTSWRPSRSLRACAEKIVVMGGSGLGSARVWPSASAYACAKAALYRLVEVVHEEVHARGIDINCLAPGAVKTGITDQAIACGCRVARAASSREPSGSRHRWRLARVRRGGCRHSPQPFLRRSFGALDQRQVGPRPPRRRGRGDERPDLFRLRRIDDTLYVRKDA